MLKLSESYFFQNLYRSMLISLESDRQIIPTLSGFISNHTNIYYQTMESYYQTMVDTLFSDFYSQNSAKSFTKQYYTFFGVQTINSPNNSFTFSEGFHKIIFNNFTEFTSTDYCNYQKNDFRRVHINQY